MDKILGVGGPVKGLDALKTHKKYCIYISVHIVVVFFGKASGRKARVALTKTRTKTKNET